MVSPNICIRSNIYVLSDNQIRDKIFLAKVLDGKALKYIKSHTDYGFNNKFTDVQRLILKNYPYECHYNQGKEVYGITIKDDEIHFECRCRKSSCPHFFKECRPDYNENLDSQNELLVKKNNQAQETIQETIIQEDINKEDFKEDFNYDEFLNKNVFYKKDFSENKKYPSAPDKSAKTIWEKIKIYIGRLKDNIRKKIKIYIGRLKDNIKPEVIEIQQDDKQNKVIKFSVDKKILVNAGPGTGKTYSVIERIKYLIEHEEIDPKKILILTFSRSATKEIKNRVYESSRKNEMYFNVYDLNIRTFDSFCTKLLAESGKEEDLAGKGYDERIEMAINLINNYKKSFSKNVDHFIVDEIQDIVGIRASLVKNILEAINCGFTLFGDSCQAIYGWAIRSSKYNMTSSDLYEFVKNKFSSNLEEVEYNFNHRQSGEINIINKELRSLILNKDKDINYKVDEFKNIFGKINSFHATDGDKFYGKNQNLSQAFLCRTNGETLKLSRIFRKQNIDFSIYRNRDKNNYKPWLGILFKHFNSDVIGYDTFTDIYNNVINHDINEAKNHWKLLKNIEGQSYESRLDVDKVTKNIQKLDKLYEDLFVLDKNKTIISTIHRSKGKEYDEVYLLNSYQNYWLEKNMDEEELKVGYVGITRPKKTLNQVCLESDNFSSVKNLKDKGRDIYRFYEVRKKAISLIEVRQKDIDSLSFINSKVIGNVEENQNYIINKISKGDEVVLIKLDTIGNYGIYHKNNLIGLTSSHFNKVLNNIHRKTKKRWFRGFQEFPSEVIDVFIENKVSFIQNIPYNDEIEVPDKFRKINIWNGVVLAGFGRISSRYN